MGNNFIYKLHWPQNCYTLTSSHQSQNKNFIDTSEPDSQENRNKNDYFQTNKDWIGENHIINNSYFMDSLFTSHIRTAKDFYQTIVCGKYEDATHRDNCQFYYYHLRDKEEWFQDQTDLEINVWLYLDA